MRILRIATLAFTALVGSGCRTYFDIHTSAIDAGWVASSHGLRPCRLEDRIANRSLPVPNHVFTIRLQDGRVICADTMTIIDGPTLDTLGGNPNASRLAEHAGTVEFTAVLEDDPSGLRATWRAIGRGELSYVRQEVTLAALKKDVSIAEICLVDMNLPGARVAGTVPGSPVVAGNVFVAMESPLSSSTVDGDHVRCALARELPLRAGQSLTCSSVIGTTTPGQLRRGFLAYLENERAHPYRPFLHYNSWYDIGYFTKFDEAAALDVIQAFGTELVKKRDVTMSSFLFDDGWDDPATLWHFHSGFPHGFTSLREAAATFNAAPGVWMSPWGGYGKPHDERIAYGKANGFETNAEGFALSGPTYYRRFEETCLKMIRDYGVNQFKFDGTGSAATAFPGSEFGSDFEAAIHLIERLRAEKPDLFVNLTTGTYPSPFWLRYADSIWRGGEDHDFAGVGSDRQRWITYRDGDTYENVVKRGPLYPLNSLMLHGLIFAAHANKLNVDPGGDFDEEVHSYFGSGTQLQEMYVTHSLLRPEDWDAIAEAAKWARRNAGVLVDTHWVGGDPKKLEVYGWASWSPQKGILVLRNPSDREQTFALDPRAAFELPVGAPTRFAAQSPWRKDRGREPIVLEAGVPHEFSLRPFEVLTLEATPAAPGKA